MEVDWGDKLKLNNTSDGCMLMEIDWGGKFSCTSSGCPMANWLGHETPPTGHNTSEVDWGGHDPNPNHINEPLLSEVDWGAHDSSLFLFLVNMDYDVKPNESSIQGLWGELQHRTSSILLIGLQTDSLATGHPQLDTTPQKLIGVVMTLTLTISMSPCSLKLIGEHMTQASSFFWLTWIMM